MVIPAGAYSLIDLTVELPWSEDMLFIVAVSGKPMIPQPTKKSTD